MAIDSEKIKVSNKRYQLKLIAGQLVVGYYHVVISVSLVFEMIKVIFLLCVGVSGVAAGICGNQKVPSLRDAAEVVVGEGVSIMQVWESDADGFPVTVMATTIRKFDQ